ESVVVVCWNPVMGFRMPTVAPATTALVGSTTVPSIVPLATDCAESEATGHRTQTRAMPVYDNHLGKSICTLLSGLKIQPAILVMGVPVRRGHFNGWPDIPHEWHL